ncbi:hypothetical protein [Aeromonas caviae]|uniref:hypothetical protein n=1 Tax=Aeromonas caviae TaxID=648 RepID=UPI00398C9B6F
MISINYIDEFDSIIDIDVHSYNAIYHGTQIDNRTESIIGAASLKNANSLQRVYYDDENFKLNIGDEKISLHELEKYFIERGNYNILIESTSLDLPEIIYILTGIIKSNIKPKVDIIYLEPDDYNREYSQGVKEQEFHLSEKINRFKSLPLFSINTSQSDKAMLVVTLGFESSRFGQLLSEDDGSSFRQIEAFIGVPAYKPGWENRCLYKHMKYLTTDTTTLRMFPASNPFAFIQQLDDLISESNRRKLLFVSMGTKPAAIAISIFLINNKFKIEDEHEHSSQLGALYDFPVKSKNRSLGVGKIYKYTLSIK